MAGALARLASDPALRRRMGLAARARVEREFDLEQQLERWAELCRQTIAEWQVRG
jgi:glycosyltransferase involved in cell wall biosynthesis